MKQDLDKLLEPLAGQTPTMQIKQLRAQGILLGRDDRNEVYDRYKALNTVSPTIDPDVALQWALQYATTPYQEGLLLGDNRWSGYESDKVILTDPVHRRLRDALIKQIPQEYEPALVFRYCPTRKKRVVVLEVLYNGTKWSVGTP